MQAKYNKVVGAVNAAQCQGIKYKTANKKKYRGVLLMFSNESTQFTVPKACYYFVHGKILKTLFLGTKSGLYNYGFYCNVFHLVYCMHCKSIRKFVLWMGYVLVIPSICVTL